MLSKNWRQSDRDVESTRVRAKIMTCVMQAETLTHPSSPANSQSPLPTPNRWRGLLLFAVDRTQHVATACEILRPIAQDGLHAIRVVRYWFSFGEADSSAKSQPAAGLPHMPLRASFVFDVDPFVAVSLRCRLMNCPERGSSKSSNMRNRREIGFAIPHATNQIVALDETCEHRGASSRSRDRHITRIKPMVFACEFTLDEVLGSTGSATRSVWHSTMHAVIGESASNCDIKITADAALSIGDNGRASDRR